MQQTNTERTLAPADGYIHRRLFSASHINSIPKMIRIRDNYAEAI